MSQDEQDRIFGRTSRELKQLKVEATALRLEIQGIGEVLESLGQGLRLLPPHLTEEQKSVLDASKLSTLLEEHSGVWKRIERLEQTLKS